MPRFLSGTRESMKWEELEEERTDFSFLFFFLSSRFS